MIGDRWAEHPGPVRLKYPASTVDKDLKRSHKKGYGLLSRSHAASTRSDVGRPRVGLECVSDQEEVL